MANNNVFDVQGVCDYFENLVSPWLVRREAAAGRLPSFRVGKRILFDRASLEAWKAAQINGENRQD